MSHSRLVYDRFRRRLILRRSVAFVYVIASLSYLAWRWTILNPDTLGLSLIYFAAESFGFVLGLTLIFSSWTYRHRQPPPAPPDLRVDVFVTTYREPVELVRWTLVAAKEIRYPHQTIVLDDGDRAEMRALAEELGVRYLARGRNVDAKAGNLNFGLAHSTADFVMVFDADHIAVPNALDLTLGFFRDERVALVQAPQDYYNIDAFQYFNARRGGGLWHDQSFFYLIAQACRDAFNGGSCVGTSVVYRRSALDAIGGIPVDTVTEDIHTSLKLHKAGFEVVYLNESIAYGVAAADLRDYYKTRHRWAHGNLHALRLENVLFCKGLTLGQRLSYVTLGLIYLEGWQQLLLFVVPCVSLLFGWPPFQITVFNVLLVLLFPLFATLLLQELGCGLSRYWVNEVFSVARFPIHLVASWGLLAGKMAFRTSAKNIRGRVEWRLMTPQLAVLVLSMMALTVGAVSLALDFKIGPLADSIFDLAHGNWARVDWHAHLDRGYTLELVFVSGFWALFNAAKCLYVVRKAIVDARRSHDDYRFQLFLPVELNLPNNCAVAQVDGISLSWMSVRFGGDTAFIPGQHIGGVLHLPSGPLAIEAVVTSTTDQDATTFSLASISVEIDARSAPGSRLECRLHWRNREDRDRLARSLYSVDWHREFMHRHAFFTTPLEAFARLFRRGPVFPNAPKWLPALYRRGGAGEPRYAVVALADDDRSATVLAFQPLHPGAVVEMQLFDCRTVENRTIRVLQADPLASLNDRGFDGARPNRYRAVVEAGWADGALPTAIAAE